MTDTAGKTRGEIYDREKLLAIIEECEEHNNDVGAGGRGADRVRKDAEFIYMHRHGGFTIETICMMLTDFYFTIPQDRIAAERSDAAKAEREAICDAIRARGAAQ